MNKLEQAARQAFETWWEREGQEFLYALNTTTDDDIKLVAEIAWKNGAYCAEQAEQEPVAKPIGKEGRELWFKEVIDSTNAVLRETNEVEQIVSQERIEEHRALTSRNNAVVKESLTVQWQAEQEQVECKECGAKQAQIDRLMLEYCPDEMTTEQMQEWGNNQRPAEQAEQSQLADAILEPVAWMVYTADGQSVYVTDNPTDIKDGQRALPLYTSPFEPVKQEPIIDLSKLLHEDKCCYWDDERFCDCGADSYELLKWYRNNAAPVRTKDLTDDEIEECVHIADSECTEDACMPWFIEFARAVIAADREKNK